MKKTDPVLQVVRCTACGEFTIRAGGLWQCPTGCNKGKMQVAATVRVPYTGVKSALQAAK